jgi:hypothetical protein
VNDRHDIFFLCAPYRLRADTRKEMALEVPVLAPSVPDSGKLGICFIQGFQRLLKSPSPDFFKENVKIKVLA